MIINTAPADVIEVQESFRADDVSVNTSDGFGRLRRYV